MAGIFKAYDIRGTFPEELDAGTAYGVGNAFARSLHAGRVVLGRDMRASSLELSDGFSLGMRAAGADVDDLGQVTTPMLYSAIIDGGYDGGAMITASHLPAQYNGIKLCAAAALPLSEDEGLDDVEKLFLSGPVGGGRGRSRKVDELERYLDKVDGLFEDTRPLRLVVDAGNGMAGLDTPLLLARHPEFSVVPMFYEPDGSFPHHIPNPSLAEGTAQLQSRVVAEGADLGVAFDGDADRCGFVDERGQHVPADLVIALLAGSLLMRSPGSSILYDLRASHAVRERIEALGGRAERTRVGHSFIKRTMRSSNALFAGELSGHYYFRSLGYIDCGLAAMVVMLNLLSATEQSLGALAAPLRTYCGSGEISRKVGNVDALFQEIQTTYQAGRQDTLDGLTVEFPSWWFNLRRSHTEPVVRLVVEAATPRELREETEKIKRIIEKYE